VSSLWHGLSQVFPLERQRSYARGKMEQETAPGITCLLSSSGTLSAPDLKREQWYS
jgi:hypothetical protein